MQPLVGVALILVVCFVFCAAADYAVKTLKWSSTETVKLHVSPLYTMS